MPWYLYVNVSPFPVSNITETDIYNPAPIGMAVVENPIDISTNPNRVYESGINTIRDAIPTEITQFSAAYHEVNLQQGRNTARTKIIDLPESDVGLAIRGITDALIDEINLLRAQFNATTAESNQLTDTTYVDIDKNDVFAAAGVKIDSGTIG